MRVRFPYLCHQFMLVFLIYVTKYVEKLTKISILLKNQVHYFVDLENAEKCDLDRQNRR